MGIDCAREDRRAFFEHQPRERPSFCLGRKHLRLASAAALLRQDTALAFKRDVPGRRHCTLQPRFQHSSLRRFGDDYLTLVAAHEIENVAGGEAGRNIREQFA